MVDEKKRENKKKIISWSWWCVYICNPQHCESIFSTNETHTPPTHLLLYNPLVSRRNSNQPLSLFLFTIPRQLLFFFPLPSFFMAMLTDSIYDVLSFLYFYWHLLQSNIYYTHPFYPPPPPSIYFIAAKKIKDEKNFAQF